MLSTFNSNWNDKNIYQLTGFFVVFFFGKVCALNYFKNGYINAHFNNWHKIPLNRLTKTDTNTEQL